jgi:hypothetical protein
MVFFELNNFLQEKALDATRQNKEEERKKPKPEEAEGMSQRRHCVCYFIYTRAFVSKDNR